MSENRTFTVCRASAGTGKTFTLASRYIALLMGSDRDNLYRNILAVTFTNKATAEMKERIVSALTALADYPRHLEEAEERRTMAETAIPEPGKPEYLDDLALEFGLRAIRKGRGGACARLRERGGQLYRYGR